MANQRVSFNDVLSFSRASTATYFDSSGVLQTAAIDEPRRNHDPLTGEPLGVLIEPARTNLALHSSDLMNSYWQINYHSSPAAREYYHDDKIPNAIVVLATEDTLGGSVGFRRYFPIEGESLDLPATLSVLVKAGTRNNVTLSTSRIGSGTSSTFDLANLSVVHERAGNASSISSKIEDAGDGWRRLSITRGALEGDYSSVSYSRLRIQTNLSEGEAENAGDVCFYVACPQVEQGSFPTSYIPTAGAPVTRAADIITTRGDA